MILHINIPKATELNIKNIFLNGKPSNTYNLFGLRDITEKYIVSLTFVKNIQKYRNKLKKTHKKGEITFCNILK